MLKLRVVQAAFGDCLILEMGTPAAPRYILIDGGPPKVYERHLRGELQKIAASGGKLDLMILSHVDNDHIIGLLDFTSELREQKAAGKPRLIGVDGLWHNSFSDTISKGADIETRMSAMMAAAGAAAGTMTLSSMAVLGIGEGRKLRTDARLLGIPVNQGFSRGSIIVDDAPPPVVVDDVTMRIVGPTQANLDELKEAWKKWLDKHADGIAAGDPQVAAMADDSVPNLSSIMLLLECQGKTLLLTGDGRGDHLLQGLKQARLLDTKGKLHVNVLKLPHHGSDRNVDRRFFETITADQYIMSADGRHGNPDLATCIWIVEAAKKQKRKIEIIATNDTDSTRKLVANYKPATYGYKLTIMPPNAHSMTINVAP
jgi:hypothetical protein